MSWFAVGAMVISVAAGTVSYVQGQKAADAQEEAGKLQNEAAEQNARNQELQNAENIRRQRVNNRRARARLRTDMVNGGLVMDGTMEDAFLETSGQMELQIQDAARAGAMEAANTRSAGTRDAAAHLAPTKLLGRITNRAATVALVGRVSVLAIQSTQLGAALYEMPTGAYITQFAKLLSGQLNWFPTIKSEYIQRRLHEMPPVVQQAMQGLAGSKPNRLKYLSRWMGQSISGADAFFTAGTYAMILDYQLSLAKSQGMTGQEASDWAHNTAERITDRVAQPTRPGARSLFEVTSTNPMSRILWSFASDARQKFGLTAYAIANKPMEAKARALIATWLVSGVVSSLLRAAMRDVRDDNDDKWLDERNWDPKRLALSALTGPLQGVPVLGDAAEGMLYKVFGEYLPSGNMISGAERAAGAAMNTPDYFTGERGLTDALRDVEAILGGVGLISDSAASAASLSHILRDVFGVVDNFND